MKNQFIKLLIPPFILAISCQQRGNNHTPTQRIDTLKNQEVSNKNIQASKDIDLQSRLEIKIERLSKLKSNYIIKKIGPIEIENSLIGRLSKSSIHNKKLNINELKNQIYKTQKSFLKGTKSTSPNGNTYPRITVEEYIFKNIKEADKVFQILYTIKKKDKKWGPMSSVFLQENRLYLINLGGWYMIDMHKEIENVIKKRP